MMNETAALWVVSIWCAALLVWRVAAATAGSRRVWFALAAFALSATLYVGPVSRFAAAVVGSTKPCDQFENLWGVGVSGLVVAVLCIWSNRGLAMSVAASTVAATIVMVLLAATTSPSPVGCVASLNLPWYSPYWWIVTLAHIGAALAAAVICMRDAVAIGSHDRVAALAVGGVAMGFVLSAAFWLLMWTSLVTGATPPASWASADVFPLTVSCMALSAVVAAIDAAATSLRHRGAISAVWREYCVAFTSAHPEAPTPSRWHVIGPWWSDPAQTLHQIQMQTCDLALLSQRGKSEAATKPEGHKGAITL